MIYLAVPLITLIKVYSTFLRNSGQEYFCCGFAASRFRDPRRSRRDTVLSPVHLLYNPTGTPWSLSRHSHLPRQFPGSIKSRNSRFPSRRGAPSVVSLPVGRHYPGASRRFIVHSESAVYKVDGVTLAHTGDEPSRCMCIREHYQEPRDGREEGDRVNELPFCGVPGVFFLLIGMRAGGTRRTRQGKDGQAPILRSIDGSARLRKAAAEGERGESGTHGGARKPNTRYSNGR